MFASVSFVRSALASLAHSVLICRSEIPRSTVVSAVRFSSAATSSATATISSIFVAICASVRAEMSTALSGWFSTPMVPSSVTSTPRLVVTALLAAVSMASAMALHADSFVTVPDAMVSVGTRALSPVSVRYPTNSSFAPVTAVAIHPPDPSLAVSTAALISAADLTTTVSGGSLTT